MNWTTRFFVASLMMLVATIGFGTVRVLGAAYQNLTSRAPSQITSFKGTGVSAFDMQSGGVPTANPLRSSFSSDENESTNNTQMSMASAVSTIATPHPSYNDDDQGDDNDLRGTVTAVNGNMITINGQTYTLTNYSEVEGYFQVGSNVKLEYRMNSDGTMTIEELKVVNSNMNSSSSHDNYSPNNSNNNGYYCFDDDCDDGGDD